MKTLIILTLALTAFAVRAQEVTVLDEARIVYAPLSATITQQGDSYIYKINEGHNEQFAKDPIAFMKANFNIHNFIAEVANKNYDSYQVTFKSTNGLLVADYDKKGELLNTRQNFKNVVLPLDIRRDLHNTYKGWTLVKTKYTAKTKGEIIDKATYSVSLANGKQKENLKIDGKNRAMVVASN